MRMSVMVAELSIIIVSYNHFASTSESPCHVGPVTNATGNEQQIYVRDGSDRISVLGQGTEWCNHAQRSIFKTDHIHTRDSRFLPLSGRQ